MRLEGMVRGQVKGVVNWVLRAPRTPFRFRVWEVVCCWLLVSLVSISFVAEYPIEALSITVLGGALIGVSYVVYSKPIR
jgi:hypothetical protein